MKKIIPGTIERCTSRFVHPTWIQMLIRDLDDKNVETRFCICAPTSHELVNLLGEPDDCVLEISQWKRDSPYNVGYLGAPEIKGCKLSDEELRSYVKEHSDKIIDINLALILTNGGDYDGSLFCR